MNRIVRLLDDMGDAPREAIALALADAVFVLETSSESRILLCLNEADTILARLRFLGFDVVPKAS
jgi:hypothetical protein